MRAAFDAHGLRVPDGAVATTISRGRDGPQNRARRLDVRVHRHGQPPDDLGGRGRVAGVPDVAPQCGADGLPGCLDLPKRVRAAQRAVGNAIIRRSPRRSWRRPWRATRSAPMPAPVAQADLDLVCTDFHDGDPPARDYASGLTHYPDTTPQGRGRTPNAQTDALTAAPSFSRRSLR